MRDPAWSIDYTEIVARWHASHEGGAANDVAHYHAFLTHELGLAWCDAYTAMAHDGEEIVEFEDHGYRFLFDLVEERVVAAFGVSVRSAQPRDAARMSGFLPGRRRATSAGKGDGPVELADMGFRDRFFALRGDAYDRAHFISHKQGGGLDVNLFPQRSTINQGRSALGREYRAMERRCAARSGVFCFSRPVYADRTWVPVALDYGLSERVGELEVRTFPN